MLIRFRVLLLSFSVELYDTEASKFVTMSKSELP